jgi:hypothetical protein
MVLRACRKSTSKRSWFSLCGASGSLDRDYARQYRATCGRTQVDRVNAVIRSSGPVPIVVLVDNVEAKLSSGCRHDGSDAAACCPVGETHVVAACAVPLTLSDERPRPRCATWRSTQRCASAAASAMDSQNACACAQLRKLTVNLELTREHGCCQARHADVQQWRTWLHAASTGRGVTVSHRRCSLRSSCGSR